MPSTNPPSVTYNNGNRFQLIGGNSVLNGYNVHFAGTSPGDRPIVTFSDDVNNSLLSVSVIGHSASSEFYGEMDISPPGHNVSFSHGISESYGNLILNSYDGPFIIGGNSTITNDSTLSVGDPLSPPNPFVLNGSMSVSNGSTANFSAALLQGRGTIDVLGDSIVDVNHVIAGLQFDLLKGSNLYLSNGMTFQGTINEGAGGYTEIENASTAVREIFHQATGTVDLLNKSGALVADVKSSNGVLYAEQGGHGIVQLSELPFPGTCP
jgi:hypothetical protein